MSGQLCILRYKNHDVFKASLGRSIKALQLVTQNGAGDLFTPMFDPTN